MAKRVTYTVGPDDGRWSLKKRGGSRATGTFDRKEDAVRRGRELAKAQERGQLVIKKQNGRIQTEYTYGDDPFPPRG
jgi:hypothetical protein